MIVTVGDSPRRRLVMPKLLDSLLDLFDP